MPTGTAFMARVPAAARAGPRIPMSRVCDDEPCRPGLTSASEGIGGLAAAAIEYSAAPVTGVPRTAGQGPPDGRGSGSRPHPPACDESATRDANRTPYPSRRSLAPFGAAAHSQDIVALIRAASLGNHGAPHHTQGRSRLRLVVKRSYSSPSAWVSCRSSLRIRTARPTPPTDRFMDLPNELWFFSAAALDWPAG